MVTGSCTEGDDGSAYIYAREYDVEGEALWLERSQLIPDMGSQADLVSVWDSFSTPLLLGRLLKTIEVGPCMCSQKSNIWAQQAKLVAADRSPDDYFGQDLDICNNTIIVGTRKDTAYIFRRDEGRTMWTEVTQLTDEDGNNFGESVAIYNGNLIVVLLVPMRKLVRLQYLKKTMRIQQLSHFPFLPIFQPLRQNQHQQFLLCSPPP